MIRRRTPSLFLLAFFAVWSVACGATDAKQPDPAPPLVAEEPETSADVPASAASAEAAFQAFLNEARLSIVPAESRAYPDVLRTTLEWKVRRGKKLQEKWEAVISDGEPDSAQFALLRIAQAYLNLACDIAHSPHPPQLGEGQADTYQSVLDSSAFDVMETAGHALKRAAEMESDRYRDSVDEMKADWPAGPVDVRPTCVNKKELWQSTDPTPAAEVFAEECDRGTMPFCWLWAEYDEGGIEALHKSCENGFARGCKTLGDWLVVGRGGSSPRPEKAEPHYRRACELDFDEACHAQLAVVSPEREDDYRTSCLDDDDAIACLKYATVLQSGRLSPTMWSRCSGGVNPPSVEEAKSACANGDAAACAIRAAYLPAGDEYVVETVAPDDGDLDRLALQCIEGEDDACRSAAGLVVSGETTRAARACGSVLLLQACRRGDTDACGFAQGSTDLSGHGGVREAP